jgi:hypothetical protein
MFSEKPPDIYFQVITTQQSKHAVRCVAGPWRVSMHDNIRLPESRNNDVRLFAGTAAEPPVGTVCRWRRGSVSGHSTVNSNYIQTSVTRVATRAQPQMVKSKPIPSTSSPITFPDGGRP